MVSGVISFVSENKDSTSSLVGLNFEFWARKSINFNDWAFFCGQVFFKVTFALIDEASVGARSEVLGASSVAAS
jgi:hypothetical protein